MNKKDIELLAPAGDIECLIAGVQNGANAVYFGADKFNARANSKNFNDQQLKQAINYAKLRNVKTHLTLNILIKNDEFEDALKLVKHVYELGIDALIIQDLGLACKIKERFPDLEIHASTQTTTYNIEGVNAMAQLGFDRIVLARELNVDEITHICKNTNKEIEIFIHGALCISYSGQCLASSMIGARSGNRGRCAGTCRLPYELVDSENNKTVEKGYLLSSKDVCTLDILPQLIQTGVKSFKIEGRMKSPEYVGIVTAIYRKYIDLYFSNNEYIVEEKDRKMLLQIFNRGGFSTGYLKGRLGKNMMYTIKPNHIGIELGKVLSYNNKKGHVNVKLNDTVELGDSISINDSSCKISELMIQNNNIKTATKGQCITIGRIKGEIQSNDIVYKTVSNQDIKQIDLKNSKENIKRKIDVNIDIRKNEKIVVEAIDQITGISVQIQGEEKVQQAQKTSTTKQRIIEQVSKTGNTVFEIDNINVQIEDNIFVPIYLINDIRRSVLEKLETRILQSFSRKSNVMICERNSKYEVSKNKKRVSLLLNILNKNYDYTKLKNIDNIYIPFRYFFDASLKNVIKQMCNRYNVYIYLPAITKSKYISMFEKDISTFNIKGAIISNISQVELIQKCVKNVNLDLLANYTMNIFNDYTIDVLKKMGINTITISPEMNKKDIQKLSNVLNKEVIVYGRTLLMTSEYCVVGKNGDCKGKCKNSSYVLRDRINYDFPVYTDTTNCNSLIYNSKITSIEYENLNVDNIRIDILQEDINQINNIINLHINGKRLEGNVYTNGNLNKDV